MLSAYLFSLIAFSGLAAVVLCSNSMAVGGYFKLIDSPDERKRHLFATPLMGGIVILAAFVPPAVIYAATFVSERWVVSLLIWIGCVVATTLVGIADDRHSLSPRSRLIFSFVIFASAAAADPTFNIRLIDFEYPRWTLGLGTWWLAIVFTIICSVGLINAVNMADGKNGLVIGLCLGWLALLSTRAPTALVPIMALLGAVLVVLFIFNIKGRLFLGDGGAYGLGCAIALLAIMTYNTSGSHALRAISADELILLFLVPVFDSFRLTYSRLKQGRSAMSPDRNHLHHHLQDRFGWPLGLIIYFLLSFLPVLPLVIFG